MRQMVHAIGVGVYRSSNVYLLFLLLLLVWSFLGFYLFQVFMLDCGE